MENIVALEIFFVCLLVLAGLAIGLGALRVLFGLFSGQK